MAFGRTPDRRADRHLFALFLLLVLWVPLPVASNHLWAWSILELGVFAVAIGWLTMLALGRVTIAPAFHRARPALVLFALVFVWTLCQLVPLPMTLLETLSPNAADVHQRALSQATLSLDPTATRSAMMKTLAYGLLFALTLLLVNRRGRLRLLALCLVCSGVFQAAYGALMTLSGLEYGFFVEKIHSRGAVTGTFVNANHLAGYLEICIALGVGLMLADLSTARAANWRESARRFLMTILGDKARVRVALVIMVIGIVLSKSRMGNIAFFSSLLIAGGFYVVVARRFSVGIVVFFASVVLIDVLVIGNYFGVEKVAAEIRGTTAVTDVARIDVGRDTLDMLRDYPLTGTGAGSFESVYPMYDSGRIGAWRYRHAHNDYLQFASEFGLTGFALLAAIVILSAWQAVRAQLRRRDRLMRGLGCGVLMAIVALLIHSAVDFNLQIPANAATFVVVLAMGWNARWLGHHTRARRHSAP
ncbi:MAG: O-antigen ligase family protein [Gammaproteobacteria bacterium]